MEYHAHMNFGYLNTYNKAAHAKQYSIYMAVMRYMYMYYQMI